MFNASAILEDIKLPDYKGRHTFTAKLRLIIFLIFAFLSFTYFQSIWISHPAIPIIISISFLLTGIAYQNILQNKFILVSFVLEMVADMLSITLVVYMTGATRSTYFTLYMLYCSAAGMFYSPRVAFLAAFQSIFFYGLLFYLYENQVIPDFHLDHLNQLWVSRIPFIHYLNLILVIIFLPVIVYAVKISFYFTSLKERILGLRNKQLTALNRISSTIKKANSIEDVVQNVLTGVIEGLGYQVCLLVLVDKRDNIIRFHIPKDNYYMTIFEKHIGYSLGNLQLPDLEVNSIFQAIKRNRIAFRQKLSELVVGVNPPITDATCEAIQQEAGFKKYIITPLVAERKIIGAMVGISTNEFIDKSSVGILENFTDQAALAIDSAILIDELKVKNVELERANKIKSEFLAVMSHELRTPLTAVIGFSELLLEGVLGEMNSDQKDSMREVLKNGEHLLGLINSILDFAKAEAGKMELNLDSLNLEDLLNDIKSSVASLLEKKSLIIQIEIQNNLPIMHADLRKLRQIMLNLISNAIKFTPEGGKIILRANHDTSNFVIEVEDSGIGIAENNIEHIFDLFHQVDSSYTRKYQGTGLGLALTRQFVELHGGKISVRSTLDQGSVFTIIFPQN